MSIQNSRRHSATAMARQTGNDRLEDSVAGRSGEFHKFISEVTKLRAATALSTLVITVAKLHQFVQGRNGLEIDVCQPIVVLQMLPLQFLLQFFQL